MANSETVPVIGPYLAGEAGARERIVDTFAARQRASMASRSTVANTVLVDAQRTYDLLADVNQAAE